MTDSEQGNIPASEQILTEMLELVRLMLIHSENYQMPVKKVNPKADETSQAAPEVKAPKVDKTKTLPAKPEPAGKDSDGEVDEAPKKDN